MWGRTDSALDLSAVLTPLIARAIELRRGPASLVDWVAARCHGQDCSREMIDRLARELAGALAESSGCENIELETIVSLASPGRVFGH